MTPEPIRPTTRPKVSGDGAAPPQEIELEIESLRTDLADLMGELDRRRHEALDLRLQVRRHALLVGVAAGTVVLGLVAAVALRSHARQRRERMLTRVENLGRALAIASKDPDKLVRAMEQTRDPSTSILSALARIAGAAGQRIVERSL